MESRDACAKVLFERLPGLSAAIATLRSRDGSRTACRATAPRQVETVASLSHIQALFAQTRAGAISVTRAVNGQRAQRERQQRDGYQGRRKGDHDFILPAIGKPRSTHHS